MSDALNGSFPHGFGRVGFKGAPPLADACWRTNEDHPRTAAELVDAFDKTWRLIDDDRGA